MGRRRRRVAHPRRGLWLRVVFRSAATRSTRRHPRHDLQQKGRLQPLPCVDCDASQGACNALQGNSAACTRTCRAFPANRSALIEAIKQLTQALSQIEALPATPALRREQIKLQVALITALIHVKGYVAPETKAAVERARLLIEQAEALGEPLDDPILLFSVLFCFWLASLVAFNGDVLRERAAQFLVLAESQGATTPLMIGHHRVTLHKAERTPIRHLCCTTLPFIALGGAFWRRRLPSGNLVLAFLDAVDAWLSCGRTQRR
jgi:hypothetical protein